MLTGISIVDTPSLSLSLFLSRLISLRFPMIHINSYNFFSI